MDAGSGATPEEQEILGAFRWNRSDVWVHLDENVGDHLLSSLRSEKWWLTLKRLSS